MATKFKRPNKQTTIALIVITAILLIVAVTGTVAFLKDRGRAEAVESNKIQQDDIAQSDNQTSGKTDIEEQPDNDGQIGTDNSQDDEESVNNGEQNNTNEGTTVGTENSQKPNGTTQVDNIQETVIERIETIVIPEKQISEGHYVGWTPLELTSYMASSKLNVSEKDKDIIISKQAITTSGEGVATRGEEIIYKIFVKNISNVDMTDIEVKDKIPEMTTYVENSVDNSVTEVVENNNVIGLIWNLDLLKSGEEITLSFKVKVNEDATGVITNIAFANGDETEPVKNAIIEAQKTAVIEDKIDETIAKVGDKLIYTITVKNTGDVAGTAYVQDITLKDLIDGGILKLDAESEEIGKKLIEGTTVDVPENGEVTISFKTEILKVNGAIKNVAVVGEEKPEIVTDTVNITGQKTNTDIDNKVKPGDEFSYNIVLTNSGNVEGTAKVTDNVPEQLKVIGTNPTAIVNGNEVDFGDVTVKPGEQVTLTINVKVKETATGTIKNIGKVDGKDVPDTEVTIEDVINITATKTNNDEDKKVKPEETVVYTIKLSNSGNVAGKTTVTDNLPLGVDYVSSSDEGIYNKETRTVVWNNVNVPVGNNSKELTVTVKISENATGKIVNTAIVENKQYNDEGLDVVKIIATKTNNLQQIAKVNQEVTYTIRAINNGTIAGDAVITDQLPNGLTYKNATLKNVGKDIISYENGLITWNVKDLQPGEENTRELTIVVIVNDFEGIFTTITNEVKVDGNKTSDTTIEVGKPVIEALKTSKIISCEGNELTGSIVHEGDKIEYTITVKNTGKISGNVTVEDTIKDGLSYVSGTVSATVDNKYISDIEVKDGKLKLTDYKLESGKILIIKFEVYVNELADNIYSKKIDANVAVVNENDITDDKNYVVVKSNIIATKTSEIIECSKNVTTGNIVHEGDKIRYVITAENIGTDAEIITISDNIPSGLTYIENSLNARLQDNTAVNVTINGKQVKLDAYKLKPGKKLTISFDVIVDDLEDGIYSGQIEKNIAILNDKNVPDDEGYNVEKPQIESSKTVDKIKAEYNDELTYTITVKNISSVEANVDVNDPIPEYTEYVPGSITINNNPVEDSTHYTDGKIIYTGKLTQKDETVVIKFKVKVTVNAIGTTIKNIAIINDEEKTATTTVVKNVTVGTISSKVNPIDLVLVLDVSGSMNDNGKLTELKSSAKTLVNKVFETDTTSTITVITYSESATLKGTFKYSKKNNLLETIEKLGAAGGTNIYAALSKTNEVVPESGAEREKVVVFLTDGSPTIPSSSYIDGVHSGDNTASGYTNNLKDYIVQQANNLKALNKVKKVYSIGLGIDNFSDTYVRHVEECTVENVDGVTSSYEFDKNNKTFTIILTNSNNKDVTLSKVNAEFTNISELASVSNDGTINRYNKKTAVWENISISANGTVKLTGTYKTSNQGGFGYMAEGLGENNSKYGGNNSNNNNNNKELSVRISIEYLKTCITDAHKEQFEGKDLYSVIKTKDGKQYHCITEKTYSKYLLSKISSDGTIMNVTSVSTAFDKILEEISTTTNTYTVEMGSVIEIPETRKITSDVKVTIGTTSNSYKLSELLTGVNGIVYVQNVGFRWTITEDALLNSKLFLEYKIEE